MKRIVFGILLFAAVMFRIIMSSFEEQRERRRDKLHAEIVEARSDRAVSANTYNRLNELLIRLRDCRTDEQLDSIDNELTQIYD